MAPSRWGFCQRNNGDERDTEMTWNEFLRARGSVVWILAAALLFVAAPAPARVDDDEGSTDAGAVRKAPRRASGSQVLAPAKKVPIVYDVDVVVAGGGASGTMAAIAAARQGAKTVVIDRFGRLGGNIGPGLYGGGTIHLAIKSSAGPEDYTVSRRRRRAAPPERQEAPARSAQAQVPAWRRDAPERTRPSLGATAAAP